MCEIAQSCPPTCNPMDCSPPGSSVHRDSPGKNTRVGCHSLLQGVSFVVQKLLSLIRSHLFIFAFISNILRGGSWRILLWCMSESVLPMFSRSFNFHSFTCIWTTYQRDYVFSIVYFASFVKDKMTIGMGYLWVSILFYWSILLCLCQ